VSTIIKGGILEYDKINIEQDLNIAGNTYTKTEIHYILESILQISNKVN
jgi:hypothetical protein